MAVFRLDPCGIICILITYMAVFYADYVVVIHLVLPSMTESFWGAFCVVTFNTIIFLLIVSHLRAVLSDPGIVPIPKTSMDFSDIHSETSKRKTSDGWTVCMKCETYRPPRAHHCRVCRRCVRRMDHHCPWINNCVGEYNQRYFIQFLFYVGLASALAITLVIVSWITESKVRKEFKHLKFQPSRYIHYQLIEQPIPWHHSQIHKNLAHYHDQIYFLLYWISGVHSAILIIESILFGLFVIAIGCDQMSAILNDETAVEHVKKEGPFRAKKSRLTLLQEVFGRSHPLLWLWPFQDGQLKEPQEMQYNV